ncbi:hypothetical protein ACHAWU_009900 [Discostella pseudostelligera]|uniref:Calmodulin n=1 Tax=Discostella pseudostelligera TaxID=259834 RepID=A0ABD3M189_9STRA
MAEHGLSDDEVADLREAFSMYDVDGGGTLQENMSEGCCLLSRSGSISIDELRGVMKSLGHNPSDEDLGRMIQSVDDNGNNEIDFQEFLVLMSSKRTINDDPDRELRAAFAVFDKDGSGCISRSELKTLLSDLGQSLTDEELDAMMSEVDRDGNGEIDFEEFKAMMIHPLFNSADKTTT